jgi:quercetin dioxygenase-like cupin family protein
MNKRFVLTVSALAFLGAGCASSPDAPNYPAFVISDEIPDMFVAALPGIHAKEYTGESRSRSASRRIVLPTGWSGTTGGEPGNALEIFVLSGDLTLADVALTAGGYVYVPPGSLGFNLVSDEGATILWFLSEFDSNAVIRSPLILDSKLVDWQATDLVGVFKKELRADPGNGEQAWLMRYEPGAQIPWQSSSAQLEGYLVSGQFQDSECVAGQAYTDIYLPGGYFRRPADSVHGGPEVSAIADAVWFLRERRESKTNYDVTCLTE